MKNLRKMYSTLTVMGVIAVAIAFTVSVDAASSMQWAPSNNAGVKAFKKRIITPIQARNFLNDLDMPTRDYELTGESGPYGKYGARSDYFVLDSRDSIRFINNLTYYVSGDKSIVKAVELDLNVNDVSYKSNAIGELIKHSDGLIYKVTGQKLSPDMKKAMQLQKKSEWIVNGYKVKLDVQKNNSDSTSDKGAFSLTFLIEV